MHGLKATAAALGVIADTPPTRLSPSSRHTHWRALADRAPQLVETLRRYLTQIEVSMRPGSVALIDTTLRHLAVYLTDHHPDITGFADIRRTHIEGFKTFLTSKPGYRGKREPAKTTTGMRMGHLRGFFDRIIEWDYPDAPPRNPVFAGDMPIRDRPLPRFLPDADAAALLTAARALPDLFDRVAVEVLARTGLRKGEFLGLTRDAMAEKSGLSKSTVGRIWRRFDLKPHLVDGFSCPPTRSSWPKSSTSSGSTTTRRRRPWCSASTKRAGSRCWTGRTRYCR